MAKSVMNYQTYVNTTELWVSALDMCINRLSNENNELVKMKWRGMSQQILKKIRSRETVVLFLIRGEKMADELNTAWDTLHEAMTNMPETETEALLYNLIMNYDI